MTINCNGRLVDLETPKVMGILNLTPDSFFDGGRYTAEKAILAQAEKLLEEGATFLDLGAYSSRPGADDISVDEELHRMLPAVEAILKAFPGVILSVDTFRSAVAAACLDTGAAMINDISGGLLDDGMMKVIAKYQVPYIIMHMKGSPQTMTKETQYDDLLTDMMLHLSGRIENARKHQINDVIIDPGFGFSKTLAQNYELLGKQDLFAAFGVPLLAGLSRKSMIYKTLGTDPDGALNGTTALNMVALSNGANILRVHDVAEAMQCIRLHDALTASQTQ